MPIEEFQCTEENSARLLELRKCAERQQAESYKEFEASQRTTEPKIPDFILHPWENKCNEDDFIYVSYDPGATCDFIKGWMHVHVRKFNKRVRDTSHKAKTRRLTYSNLTIAHVNYISTNQNKSKTGPGVGRAMMEFMEERMRDKECHFVELMPLPDVVGFYTKLGYALEFEDVNYYTKWFVRKEPYANELKLYEHELNEENKKITEEMERQEEESFLPIYEQLTPKQQRNYHHLQEKDTFTRMSVIIAYDIGGIKEVRKLLK
jgi:hypothetical protein